MAGNVSRLLSCGKSIYKNTIVGQYEMQVKTWLVGYTIFNM
jgi:hypothetical protein